MRHKALERPSVGRAPIKKNFLRDGFEAHFFSLGIEVKSAMAVSTQLFEMIDATVEGLGYELVDVEKTPARFDPRHDR